MIGPFRAFPSISSEVLVSAQSSGDNDMGDKTFTNNLISAEKTHYNLHTDANVEHRWDIFFQAWTGLSIRINYFSVDTYIISQRKMFADSYFSHYFRRYMPKMSKRPHRNDIFLTETFLLDCMPYLAYGFKWFIIDTLTSYIGT